jgi:hypothetical protein
MGQTLSKAEAKVIDDDSPFLLSVLTVHDDLSSMTVDELSSVDLQTSTSERLSISVFMELMGRLPFSTKALPSLETIVLNGDENAVCGVLLCICSHLHHGVHLSVEETVRQKFLSQLMKVRNPIVRPLLLLARAGLGEPTAGQEATDWLSLPLSQKVMNIDGLTPIGNQRLSNAVDWAARAISEGRQPLPILY